MIHSILPAALASVVGDVLAAAGITHIAHGDADPIASAAEIAAEPDALALIGPLRSAEVRDAVEATGPAGLPLLAPVATAAAVTRDDEPGCEDAAEHRGTVLRIVARDTVVAQRIAADLREHRQRAYVVVGAHEYGEQLDGQLRLADLPRAEDPAEADVVVVGGLAGGPEVEAVRALAPLPVIAFDGIQGADLGEREVHIALPYGPEAAHDGHVRLEPSVRRAALLVTRALREGASGRAALLDSMRALGPFDEHGDPVDPPVWLWRADSGWRQVPERPLS